MGARMTFFRGYWYTLYKSSETERYLGLGTRPMAVWHGVSSIFKARLIRSSQAMAIEQRCSKRQCLRLVMQSLACQCKRVACWNRTYQPPLEKTHSRHAPVRTYRGRQTTYCEHAVERSTTHDIVGAVISSVDAHFFFNLCMNSIRDQLCLLF